MAKTTHSAGAAAPAPTLRIEGTARIDIQAADAAAPPGSEGSDAPRLPRFEMTAYTGAPMRVESWRNPVVMDYAGMMIPDQRRPIRLNHDPNQGVGHTEAIGVDNGHLKATGVISRDTPAAREAVSSGKNGFPWKASIGASVDDFETIPEGQSTTVNGRTYPGPVNVIRKSRLNEISLVDHGADGDTSVKVSAMHDENTAGEAASTSTSTSTVNATGTAATATTGTAATAGTTAAPDETAQAVAAARAEVDRQSQIRALGDQFAGLKGVDAAAIAVVVAAAIAEGKAVKDASLELTRAARPQAPAIHRPAAPTPKVLAAGLCMACGINGDDLAKDRDFGPEVVTAAYPLRRWGLHDVMAHALSANGVHAPRRGQELFEAVLSQQIKAEGFSSVNLPTILGNVANKILLNAFLSIEVVYDRLAEQADFSNFQTHTMARLESLGTFEKVGKDGELKNASLGQDSSTNKLDTSGVILTLTRQDIINDDLNAFQTLFAQLSRKARIAVEKSFFGVVMEASDSFYNTTLGNRLVGALAIDSLAAAEGAMLGFTDAGGDPIYATPSYVLVPPQLKYLADQFYVSEKVIAFATSKGLPTDNVYRNRFQPFTSPFLANATMPGYSASTWYLLANPLLCPAFQVAYLDGRRAPTVEQSQTMFNILGMQNRCYFDWGVAQVDGRGAVKSTAS